MTADHWSSRYIGFGYDPEGERPPIFNCWHFFRHVQREQFGRDIPPVLLGAPLLQAMRQFRERPIILGWRLIAAPAQAIDGDAVMMGHRTHPHHIGVFVADVPGVLHCAAGGGSVLNSLFHLEMAAWRITGIYRLISGEQ